MGLLGDAPAEVELQLLRNVIVREEKVIPFLEIEGGNSGPAERSCASADCGGNSHIMSP